MNKRKIAPSLVVLAAGMGSRYGSLKQIDQFGPSGETIIDYSIHDAIQAGFRKVVFIIRKNIEEEFKEVFVGKFGTHIQIEYVFQEMDLVPDGFSVPDGREKPWGTGHAVLMAKDKVDEPFAVINADDFYGVDAFRIMYDHLSQMDPEQIGACLVGYLLNNTLSDHGYVSRGICSVNEDDILEQIVERVRIYKTEDHRIVYEEGEKQYPLNGNELTSMNLFGFTPPFFEVLRKGFIEFFSENADLLKSEFFLPEAASLLVKDYNVNIPILRSTERTYGVTYREDKPVVTAMIAELVNKGVYPAKLWKEVHS